MSAYICIGMTVSIHILESILRGEGRGVRVPETKKKSEAETHVNSDVLLKVLKSMQRRQSFSTAGAGCEIAFCSV